MMSRSSFSGATETTSRAILRKVRRDEVKGSIDKRTVTTDRTLIANSAEHPTLEVTQFLLTVHTSVYVSICHDVVDLGRLLPAVSSIPHQAVMPPSTVNMPPVANEDSSAASQRIMDAISSGCPTRAIGALAFSPATNASGSGTCCSILSK
jgi:hypothetical protein